MKWNIRKLVVQASLVCLATVTISWGTGPNLVLNGDFEAGDTDFTTDYTYVPPPYNPLTSLWPEGVYTVDTDPQHGHANFWSFGDHTTGSGNMLIVNGHPALDKRVWEQTIPIFPNATYVLTYYVQACVSVLQRERAMIECSVNGIILGISAFPTEPGTWTEVSYSANSGTNTSATIALEDLNILRPGNDFVIDDISVYYTTIAVLIDIKPGSFPNSINPNSKGVIPVAILTTTDFDASLVDPETVALEGVGARAKGKSDRYGSMEDVDDDGDLDLVVQIPNTIDWEDATEATLAGETFDGVAIQGTDSVRIVPKGKK